MRVRIHRGTHQIGGTCIELEAGGERLVLDLGLPLDDDAPGSQDLPAVDGLTFRDSGLTSRDSGLLGVVISHPHQDHRGLLPQIDPAVPVYIGEAAASVLGAASFFGASGTELDPADFLRHRQTFTVGPFSITPYLNDHSGFDAYSLLIEAGGRQIFYTGDIRGHGRKAAMFEQLLRDPPRGVDVLMMEGTNVPGAGEAEKAPITERELECDLIEVMGRTEGLVLASFSAQNIDRLVTVYRAALQADRELVIDLYAATIAEATNHKSIPKPGFRNLRVFVPLSQRIRVKQARAFDRTNRIKTCRIFPEELAERADKLVMLFRESMISDLEGAACLEGARLVWSLWPGYLERDGDTRRTDFLDRHQIPLEVHHTSGHASLVDLRRLVDALSAGRVVPVHTFAPERYDEYFPGAEVHEDGEWWEV